MRTYYSRQRNLCPGSPNDHSNIKSEICSLRSKIHPKATISNLKSQINPLCAVAERLGGDANAIEQIDK